MNANPLRTLWLEFPIALMGVRFAVMLIAFTTHELAHALTAIVLGDQTPRERGRLTLNPFVHVESIGAMLGLLAGVGWSKRTVFHPYRMRIPARPGGLMASAAGPLANLGWVLLGVALMRGLNLSPQVPWHDWPGPAGWLTVLVRFNLMMLLLNLLPLFPLDGFQAVHFLLPARSMIWWHRASAWTTAVLGIGLFIFMMLPTSLLDALFRTPMRWIDLVLWGR